MVILGQFSQFLHKSICSDIPYFYNRFYEEINITHTVVVFTSFLHVKKKRKRKKDFSLYLGNSIMMYKKISYNFIKSPLKFCLISQILVHSL